jgi:integrase/recombinase XerC
MPRRAPETPTRRRLPPEVLSPEEVTSLMDACGDESWAATRNRALIAVLYRAGLRIGEALALYPKDVDPDAGWIRVLRGKGGSSRTVGIDPTGARPLAGWLLERARLGHGPKRPVFVASDGLGLRPDTARRLLSSLGRKAGIERRVHPHGLRHTHAAELRAEWVDIGIISRQLGHRSIGTTARYLDHIAAADVVHALRNRI